jgi:KUP system potassium uptake protein
MNFLAGHRGHGLRLSGDIAGTARAPHGSTPQLALAAIGVVCGNIGTSPLYAMDQLFRDGVSRAPDHVLGGVSLVIWAITLIVSIKYAALVLRAQNEGEGGVFALYGLLHDRSSRTARLVLLSLMLGAGLLLGDGMISPAISVLSAVEGLRIASPHLGHSAVLFLTIVLLVALFSIQSRGSYGVGKIFGPIVLVWFVVIAVLGLWQVAARPEILAAFNPVHGLRFLFEADRLEKFEILGAVMLVITGGEAMYADLGHFGAKPIRLGWFAVAFPALLLIYLGQGSFLLSGAPVRQGLLFYSMTPESALVPMVALATMATIIASQSLISGAFSLVSQAIRLGLFPRITLTHTHERHAGQIYAPFVNWALLVGCVALVLGFGTAHALAAAYGLAVSGVMVITSLAMFLIARRYWGWSRLATACVWGPLTVVSGAFFVASTLKFFEGGFIPMFVGLATFVVMGTWRWGRKATFVAYEAKSAMTLGELVEKHRDSLAYIERSTVVMSPKSLNSLEDRAPALAQMMWDRSGVLPRHLIFVEVTHVKAPYVDDNRYHVTNFYRAPDGGGIIGVELRFGFMEEPDVEKWLEGLARHKQIDLPIQRRRWIVHVAHENLLPPRHASLSRLLRFRLFQFLRLVSRPASYYYGLGNNVQLTAEIFPVRLR